MAYAIVSDVTALFRRLVVKPDTGDEKTNTVITTEEMESFIDDAEAMINARLSACYKLPVVDTDDLKILRTVTKYKVAHIVDNVLSLTKDNSRSDKTQEFSGNWGAMAEKILKQICPPKDCKDKCNNKPDMPLNTPMLDDLPPTEAAVFSSSNNVAIFNKYRDNW